MGAIMVLGKGGYVEIRGNIYKVNGVKKYDAKKRQIYVEREALPHQGVKKDGRKLYSVKLFEPGAIYDFVEITKNNRVYRHFELVREVRKDAIEIEKIPAEEVARIFSENPLEERQDSARGFTGILATIVDSARVFMEVLKTNIEALRRKRQFTREMAEFLIAQLNEFTIEIITEAVLSDPDFEPHLKKIEELLAEGDYNGAVNYARLAGISLAQELGVEDYIVTDAIIRAVKKLGKTKKKGRRGKRSRRKSRAEVENLQDLQIEQEVQENEDLPSA